MFNSAFAQSNDAEQQDEPDHPFGVITSEQLMNDGSSQSQSAEHFLFQAQRAFNYDKIEQALALVRRSLDMNYNDMDAHCLYADTLEKILKKQKDGEQDPEMFKACVREWLIVLRNEVGDEKGLNVHGIGIPGMGKFYEDEDHAIRARTQLVQLTGTAPSTFETDNHYLKRVLTAKGSVSGKVVKGEKKAKNVAGK